MVGLSGWSAEDCCTVCTFAGMSAVSSLLAGSVSGAGSGWGLICTAAFRCMFLMRPAVAWARAGKAAAAWPLPSADACQQLESELGAQEVWHAMSMPLAAQQVI